MPRFLSGLSFHTKLTLTIAGAFIGATAVILILALFVARSLGIGVVTLNAADTQSVSDAGAIATAVAVSGGHEGMATGRASSVSVLYSVVDGGTSQIVQAPIERLPTLIRWSVVVLIVFAMMAVAIASWISRRSLGRIGAITQLAHGLSEERLDRRLNLTGPDDEIKQLGDTFDGMLDRLQSAFDSQNQFVANASHELRTPLTIARTSLEIPLAQGKVPAALRPPIERALEANARSERLIDALLVLARGQLAKTDPVPIDLGSLTERVIDGAREEGVGSEIAIHAEIGAIVTVMHGDPSLMEHAIRNLVENAIRHNAPGGEVWISLADCSGGVQLAIENTGIVYDAASVTHLVEPFHRYVETRLAGGSGPRGFGLGLAIVESIMTLHGGTLELAARANGGLVVKASFPGEDAT